ncbi:hypothetical protein [Pedobacter punctiformis]|uniref:DUF420 domain-containing protein n=1 Tax=Pedobacter punctiformis TaxID=3004097 RepID=A0ABT4L8T5_9SPHI|nr:hypothetical protein [Pedobacter sp. HCMS5-2]MCZ4243588.1 hypothetical protein [Pedobacter sp. HCMS5-2]
MTDTNKKVSILKILIIIIPTVFLLLIIWLATVYIGDTYFNSKASAEQFLLWILSGSIIFLGYPIATKSMFHVGPSNKTHWKATSNLKAFNRSDWLFFLMLHIITMPVLFWAFGNLQHHRDIYNFFVEHFGKNYKGAPNFPILLAFFFGTFMLLALFYIIFLKIRYGTYNEPKFLSKEKEVDFNKKMAIYFSFVASTSLVVMFLYYLKVILVMQ